MQRQGNGPDEVGNTKKPAEGTDALEPCVAGDELSDRMALGGKKG